MFVALGATETVLVPDALLGFDLFHLKDGLLAGSAIGSVNLGALNKKKSVRDARNYEHAWLTLNFSWAFDESDERTWRTFFFCRASNLLKLDFCKSRFTIQSRFEVRHLIVSDIDNFNFNVGDTGS